MIRVEAHNRFNDPQVIEATRVVLYDSETNQPLAIAVQLQDKQFHICHLQDPEFATLARMMGLGKTAIVKQLK